MIILVGGWMGEGDQLTVLVNVPFSTTWDKDQDNFWYIAILGDTDLCYFNIRRWSNLHEGFVKQCLRITLLTENLQVDIFLIWSSQSPVGVHFTAKHRKWINHFLQNHHDAVIDDSLQAEQGSLVHVSQVDVLVCCAIPGWGKTFIYVAREIHTQCLIAPQQLWCIVLEVSRSKAVWVFCLPSSPPWSFPSVDFRDPGFQKCGQTPKLGHDCILPFNHCVCTFCLK